MPHLFDVGHAVFWSLERTANMFIHFTRADWLLKLRKAFAIHLRAIRAEFAPENVVIFAGINELKSYFLLYYLPVLVYIKTTIHLAAR